MGGDQQAVEARMSRQAILTRDDPAPPRVSVLLAETVLLNPVGGAEVMREQLEHLITAQSARLSVQVVPYPSTPGGLPVGLSRDHIRRVVEHRWT